MSELLKSKKFVMAAVGLVAVVLSWALGAFGVPIPDDKIAEFLLVLVAYILGQGLADIGKASAEIAADSAASSAPKRKSVGTGI